MKMTSKKASNLIISLLLFQVALYLTSQIPDNIYYNYIFWTIYFIFVVVVIYLHIKNKREQKSSTSNTNEIKHWLQKEK